MNRTLLVLASSGLIGAALAGAVCTVRRVRRTLGPSDWRIGEMDLLRDLVRIA